MSHLTNRPFHDEVLVALRSAAPHDREIGDKIRADRGSNFEYLGLRTPERRRLVKAGFSFYGQDEARILQVWDSIWSSAEVGDVLFTVLDYYRERLKADIPPGFWPTARNWIGRVDNWAHADDLARVYSWALAAHQDEVYPQLVAWNALEQVWHRRVSIVSLIHYSGKNSVFVSPEIVFPLIENCLLDGRAAIQNAVGWVLREMEGAYRDDTLGFIEEHRAHLSAVALRTATSRMDAAARARIAS